MAEKTKIEWAHATFNSWWGCEKVSESPACHFCYAEQFSKRYGFKLWGRNAPRRFFGDQHWSAPLKWNARAESDGQPFRVFCASMADICEDRPDLYAPRQRLMRLIEETPALTWLLLTKRPENFRAMFWPGLDWPRNVWALTTAEDQERLNQRVRHLFRLPCAIRGISYEPAIGPLDLSIAPAYVDWVICGGESGPKARPFSISWALSVRDQCARAGIAFFMKQLGSYPILDPRYIRTLPGARRLRDKKGGDMDEWPEDLRVREFPATEARVD